MAASWAQQNIGRSQVASDALFKGQDAKNKAWQTYADFIKQQLALGEDIYKTEKNDALQRALPEIMGTADVNKALNIKKGEAAGMLGVGNEGNLSPGQSFQIGQGGAPDLGAPQTPQVQTPVIPENLQFKSDYTKPPVEPEPAQRETIVGNLTKYSGGSGQTPESLAMKMTGRKEDAINLKYYLPGNPVPVTADNPAGMKTVLDARGQIKSGVQVDYSGLRPSGMISNKTETEAQIKAGNLAKGTAPIEVPAAGSDGYRRFMEANNIKPGETPNTPIEVPEGAKMPGQQYVPPTPMAQLRTKEGLPPDWYKQSKMAESEIEIDKAKRTERYAVLRGQVEQDNPGWTSKQLDDRAMLLYLGWQPIDYSQGGSGDSMKKWEEEEGTLKKHISSQLVTMMQGDSGGIFQVVDGRWQLAPGTTPEQAANAISQNIARAGEPGYTHYYLFAAKERGDWAKQLNDIKNARTPEEKAKAIEAWRQTELPFIKDMIGEKIGQKAEPSGSTSSFPLQGLARAVNEEFAPEESRKAKERYIPLTKDLKLKLHLVPADKMEWAKNVIDTAERQISWGTHLSLTRDVGPDLDKLEQIINQAGKR